MKQKHTECTISADIQWRIKIPGIYNQNQKYRNENIQTITEPMKQQHTECTIDAQHKKKIPRLTKAQGVTQGGIE